MLLLIEKIILSCLTHGQGETQDLLFIATERYKFCVLQWDAEAAEVITRFGSYLGWL